MVKAHAEPIIDEGTVDHIDQLIAQLAQETERLIGHLNATLTFDSHHDAADGDMWEMLGAGRLMIAWQHAQGSLTAARQASDFMRAFRQFGNTGGGPRPWEQLTR